MDPAKQAPLSDSSRDMDNNDLQQSLSGFLDMDIPTSDLHGQGGQDNFNEVSNPWYNDYYGQYPPLPGLDNALGHSLPVPDHPFYNGGDANSLPYPGFPMPAMGNNLSNEVPEDDYALFVPEVSDDPSGFDDSSEDEDQVPVESSDEADEADNPAKKRKISKSKKARSKNQSNKKPAQGKRAAVKPADSYDYGIGYDPSLAPLCSVREWFSDLTDKLHELNIASVIDHLNGRPLKVATMCSGTESPILALKHISQNLKTRFSLKFELDHLFSAEIVPFKQAFIERNFKPPIIFSDVTELSKPREDPTQPLTGTTAYGGKATLPGDLDLLIAGFVCSDFSTLNNVPKTIEDHGESGDTFYAIRDYAREHKPKMVILENVVSVPWTQAKADKNSIGLDKHFESIGYVSKHVILDTKDFYVPQTRQRGYLVAIHKGSFSGSDEELVTKLDEWAKLLHSLKRSASVPAELLLLKSDDPRLKYTQIEEFDPKKKIAVWDKCHRGHELYKHLHKLGPEHPITLWAAGGFKRLPDYYKLNKGATERVLDTLDISHLRCIKRNFDNAYWNRLLELSQNVYRITDTAKSGIMPCITPTGFPFSTLRGAGITGFEALMFQALDADTLDVTNLSHVELKSLAGNAMTSTVVGAVLGAALITFHGVLNRGTGYGVVEERLLPALATDRELSPEEGRTGSYDKLSVAKATGLAAGSRRLCYCEGRNEKTAETLQQCSICCHTTCIACGKNPSHRYQKQGTHLPTSGRKTPFFFEQFMKRHLPKCVRFNVDKGCPKFLKFKHQMEENRPYHINAETWALTTEAIDNALSSVVYFREAIRSESWHIHFSSPPAKGSGSRLELVISGHDIEWLLYATVPPTEPLESLRRIHLEKFPCARMRPTGSHIDEGTWELYMPELKKIDALIKPKGELVKSYAASVGLEEVPSPSIWNKCTVEILNDADKDLFDRDISGEYEHSPVCGQAYSSLYVNVATKGSNSPLFLLFDHEKSLRDPLKDSFVFTDDITRLEYGEYRRAFGRLSPEFHPSGSISCKTDRDIVVENPRLTVLLDKETKGRELKIFRDGSWGESADVSMVPFDQPKLEYLRLQTAKLDVRNISCHRQQTVFCCNAEVTCNISDRWIRNTWTELSRSLEAAFFKEFRWLLESGLQISGRLDEDLNWQSAVSPKYLCNTCAPEAPKMLWTYTERNKQAPFEDPQDASLYEHALKDRPLPLTVRYRIENSTTVNVQVNIDPATLMHRAWGQLALTGNTDNINICWRLVTDANSSAKPQFRPLRLSNSNKEELATQPGGIVDHYLRAEQLRNLSWCIKQERAPRPFVEEAIVEDAIKKINYRAEGKATREVTVCGGVLAHEVGFGKTLIMLGLLDSQAGSDQQHSQDSVPGRIPVKATIVFCPPHLVGQWTEEVLKFVPGKNGKILSIGTFQKLKKLTIESFQEAEIVIVNWKLVESESYTMAQAQFAGMVEPDTGASDRAFRCWYSTALENFGRNVQELKSRPATFGTYLENEFEVDKAATQSTHAIVPSKRLTGAAYQNKSSNLAGKGSTKRKRPAKVPTLKVRTDLFDLANVTQTGDFRKTKCPLLELFSFARVVYDEYTYLKDGLKQVLTVLEFIHAPNKWLLSGTPDMAGFSDIKVMARFLGINLGINDYTLMKSDVLNRELREMTRSEKFLTYRDSPSPAWQMNRHSYAQDFLNHFVRQDSASISHIEEEVKLTLVDQPIAVKAAYDELLKHLESSKYDLAKRVQAKDHKSKLIHDALSHCQDPEEVFLLRAAAHYRDIVHSDSMHTMDSELCDRMVEIRQLDYNATKEKLQNKFKQALRTKLVDEYSAGFYEEFQRNVNSNHFGDLDTTLEISQFISEAEEAPCGQPSEDEQSFTFRELSTSMSTLLTQLVDLRRSLRYAQSAKSMSDHTVACSRCSDTAYPAAMTLLSQCGHVFCSRCLGDNYGSCVAEGCSAKTIQQVPVSDLIFPDGTDYTPGKIELIIGLVQYGIPQDDKVLVFVQFPKLLRVVRESLKSNNIDSCDLGNAVKSSKTLTEFQKASSNSTRIMTLNIGDASAAGSNLAMANHVIFVSPYHTKGTCAQEKFEAAMTQAIGRARRFGQKKKVYVYHFLVRGTADIDIVEFRNKSIVTLNHNYEVELIKDSDREKSIFGTPFYDRVSRELE